MVTFMPNVVFLNAAMLTTNMLNVLVLNVILLNVVAPSNPEESRTKLKRLFRIKFVYFNAPDYFRCFDQDYPISRPSIL